MNIYAIRDRLIDYYMRAFSAPDDKDVLASIAATINEGDPNSALAKSPHHFEIWRLGKVTEDGDLRPGKELIADCSSLVRSGVWDDTHRRTTPAPEAPTGFGRAAGRPISRHAANNGALPREAPPKTVQGAETQPAHQGSPER